MPNTITLSGEFVHEETEADEILSPGHLLEISATGKVQKHTIEGGFTEKRFAVEDALQGRTITDAYADGDKVMNNIVQSGSRVQAFLKGGENVAIGEQLISAGDGTLIAVGTAASAGVVEHIVGHADVALDLGAAGDTLLVIRVW